MTENNKLEKPNIILKSFSSQGQSQPQSADLRLPGKKIILYVKVLGGKFVISKLNSPTAKICHGQRLNASTLFGQEYTDT